MSKDKKLKLVIICNFSNPKIQKKLHLRMSCCEFFLRKLLKKQVDIKKMADEYGIWNTNAFCEYEKLVDEVELHVVAPHSYLVPGLQEFELNGIWYHFFQNEDCLFINRLKNKLPFISKSHSYRRNRNYIRQYIEHIKPDIVYLIGAENPFYSLSALDIPHTIPVVVHLQTLMNDPEFEKNYPISHENYMLRAENELKVLSRADFIATDVYKFVHIIRSSLLPNALILKSLLALGENIEINKRVNKEYDFVYFAGNINKAFDLALEGFALAYRKNNQITLRVVGFYGAPYKEAIDTRIRELGLQGSISFTGLLPTHADVLNEIQRAQYALLPLKIDITSSTIREAMACGLPVVTTITTDGTPMLNEQRETVLLSAIGDHQALADNMLKLINDSSLAERLRVNGELLMKERYGNFAAVKRQIACLYAARSYFLEKVPIPADLVV